MRDFFRGAIPRSASIQYAYLESARSLGVFSNVVFNLIVYGKLSEHHVNQVDVKEVYIFTPGIRRNKAKSFFQILDASGHPLGRFLLVVINSFGYARFTIILKGIHLEQG